MADAWKVANVTMAMSKPDLLKIALGVPSEFRPPQGTYTNRPNKAELIEFIRSARAKFYDAPIEVRRPAPKGPRCEVTASEVNQMLRSFPTAAAGQ